MEDNNVKMENVAILFAGIEVVAFVFLFYILDSKIFVAALITALVNLAGLAGLVVYSVMNNQKRFLGVSRILGSEAKSAFDFGMIGMITYDEQYKITWMSELFDQRNISNKIDKKLTMWIPELSELFQGDTDTMRVEVDGYIYDVTRKEDARILFFKDVTQQSELEESYEESKIVLGLIHLDNYEETIQYEDEQMIAMINSRIRQRVFEWANSKNIAIRRLKDDRFFVVLNEKIYKELVEERFSIMNDVRSASNNMEVSITLSMAFARGSNDISKLDEMLNGLLELAQTRGGDQVAIKKLGEDVKYFGGNSEAIEKRSRVRVRVMAQTLRDLILQASNVIIVGHKEMDFDCMGSAICMSRIVQLYEKQVCIIAKTGGIEAKLKEAMDLYKDDLNERHLFVSEMEAMNQYREDTLVIMVDHHSTLISNGQNLLSNADKIAIVDHHRRSTELNIAPIFAYIEASASSASEMITELLQYQAHDVDLDSAEATIMLAGIYVDTNRFKQRTGSRTFDAASALRKYGADPVQVDNFLKDEYDDFENKTEIIKFAEKFEYGTIIVPVKLDKVLSRSIISQAADQILSVKEVEAVFVVAMIEDNVCGISARSNGKINVQVVMEKMNGGGHRTGAAVQRENTTVDGLCEELKTVLLDYCKEEGF